MRKAVKRKSGSYGRFQEDTGDFVVVDPCTPSPWINYLMGKNMQAFISQAAGGVAWFREPVHGRLTRYRFNGLPVDSPGFYLYIRDGKDVWNPSFRPVMARLDKYECRHAPGITRFLSSKNGLDVELRYFIPVDDDVMIWDAFLVNNTGVEKRVQLYTYIEFSLHDYAGDSDGFCVAGNQYRAYFDRTANGVVMDYFAYEAPFPGKSIFASTRKISKFEINRDVFIGAGRTEANPVGLERGLSCSELKDGGGYSCGVLENELVVPPGAGRRISYIHAVSSKLAKSRNMIKKYSRQGVVDRAYDRVLGYWRDTHSAAGINTPDPEFNAMMNVWFPYNSRVAFNISRSISSRHTGSSDALRFRDSMQDTMACVTFAPKLARAKILTIYKTMLADGRTVTGVNPVTMRTSDTDWTRIDGALWGVFTVYRYLAETGDYTLLDEVVPYYDKGEGTVLEHLLLGMRFIGEHDGAAGLPKIFDVDWNDMLILFSKDREDAQSVMVAEQFIYAACLLLEILASVRRAEGKVWLKRKIRHYTDVLNSKTCWDGLWFRRLLMRDITMGDRSSREASIFLNTQSWSVIAGTLDPVKTRQAMDSVNKRLATEYGIRLFSPPFTKMPDNKTLFNCNTPGAGENGGIFLHANTWAVMAEALLGNTERAWRYFHAILPYVLSAGDPDRYANEPYVFSSWIYGPDHQRFGRGQLSWLTGGASWMHTIGLEYILGMRPTLDGIVFNPCVPAQWKMYRIRRRLRGCLYNVIVKNRSAGTGGARVLINGSELPGNLLPYSSGKSCDVSVDVNNAVNRQ